jgi:UDP-N-acetylglucosamine 2-epimerase (hydrolysing)
MKKIIFVTATRADYGKLKSIILSTQKSKNFNTHIFVTGMHNLTTYGSTYKQILKDRIKNVKIFKNQILAEDSDKIFSKTILGFSKFVKKIKPDLVMVHGDRMEPLACAIVCCLNNLKIAHFEGGELSGTVDEIFRHSISKLCNIHFVTNSKAKKRLLQMGELNESVFITGSPDVDLILSKNLPSLPIVKKRYNINYSSFILAIFHPITTDIKNLKFYINNFIKALKLSKENIILIYPNNDLGSDIILKEYKKIKNKNILIFPSLRFEYYLTLLKNCKYIIGNSSSGIMEASYYGTPTINIGNRQNNRANIASIINCGYKSSEILKCIKKNIFDKKIKKTFFFGYGNSKKKILKILNSKKIWKLSNQKQFKDLINNSSLNQKLI